MTRDNLATINADAEEDEGLEKYLIAADAVETGLSYFRHRVWRKLPFDFRLEHADTMRFLSGRIAAAAERLRDADRELRLAIENEKDLFEELGETHDKLDAMQVLSREQAE